MSLPKWGIVSTIKAPTDRILEFCAHHLTLGAHRIYVYLDDPDSQAYAQLSAHPKVRPTRCDAPYWSKQLGRRPKKHQARQVENARHAYARPPEVDWLAHIDVDEFLWPHQPLADQLAQLPSDCMVGRIRPAEALANPHPDALTHFKRLTIDRATRDRQTRRVYPTFGPHLNGGFLSHVQGKLIYRTGLPDLQAKIHNIWIGKDMNPGQQELPQTELLHLHAHTWETFWHAFQFRLEKGSYRSELRPATKEGVTMHELLSSIHRDTGEQGLRLFFEEVCTATPDLLARLKAENLLSSHDLNLSDARTQQFPAPESPKK